MEIDLACKIETKRGARGGAREDRDRRSTGGWSKDQGNDCENQEKKRKMTKHFLQWIWAKQAGTTQNMNGKVKGIGSKRFRLPCTPTPLP